VCHSLIISSDLQHSPVSIVANGILELKREKEMDNVVDNDIQSFLDRFYMSRIGKWIAADDDIRSYLHERY
jgi:hypothetical protein